MIVAQGIEETPNCTVHVRDLGSSVPMFLFVGIRLLLTQLSCDGVEVLMTYRWPIQASGRATSFGVFVAAKGLWKTHTTYSYHAHLFNFLDNQRRCVRKPCPEALDASLVSNRFWDISLSVLGMYHHIGTTWDRGNLRSSVCWGAGLLLCVLVLLTFDVSPQNFQSVS